MLAVFSTLVIARCAPISRLQLAADRIDLMVDADEQRVGGVDGAVEVLDGAGQLIERGVQRRILDESTDGHQRLIGVIDQAFEVDLAQVVDDLARLCRRLLERGGDGGDLRRIRRLLQHVGDRGIRKEVELNEQQAGEQALDWSWARMPLLMSSWRTLSFVNWTSPVVMTLLGSSRT